MSEQEVVRLIKEATASLKSDVAGAVKKLETAYALVRGGNAEDVAFVAEELARAWSRKKSNARSLYYASKATELAPERKAAWTTLAKTCELVASRTQRENKQRRARALYRAAAKGFKKAASLTSDREDKQWLIELAQDAARQAKPPEPA
jgi:hypothetical protein